MTLKFDTIDISKKLPSCGEEMREIFPLQFDKFACCNQGAYGTAPKMVLKYKYVVLTLYSLFLNNPRVLQMYDHECNVLWENCEKWTIFLS